MVTDDLKPLITDDRFFRCGEKLFCFPFVVGVLTPCVIASVIFIFTNDNNPVKMIWLISGVFIHFEVD